MKNPVVVGRFGRVFGIKGWIHVISFTDPIENILSYFPWSVLNQQETSGWQELVVVQHQQDDKGIRVKLEGYQTPEEAQCLVNKEIAIPRDMLPPLSADQYYWSELEGLLVKNTQDIVLGHVDHLFETGSNDVMAVKGDKMHWIPFLPSVILQVNLEEKWILVDWDADF